MSQWTTRNGEILVDIKFLKMFSISIWSIIVSFERYHAHTAKDFGGFSRPRLDLGLILLILMIVINRHFTSHTHFCQQVFVSKFQSIWSCALYLQLIPICFNFLKFLYNIQQYPHIFLWGTCNFHCDSSCYTLTLWNKNPVNAKCLTHWGWVTHICISKLTIIGSDNGTKPLSEPMLEYF